MSMPSNAVQLASNVVAGTVSQLLPNSRCAMMISANAIVLIGSALVESMSHSRSIETKGRSFANRDPCCSSALPTSKGLGAFYSMFRIAITSNYFPINIFPVTFVNTVPYIMCMSLISSNIGGFTKKTTTGVGLHQNIHSKAFCSCWDLANYI